MRDQLKELEAFLSVCILQSAPEDEGEQKVTIPKMSTSVVWFLLIQRSLLMKKMSQKYLKERSST